MTVILNAAESTARARQGQQLALDIDVSWQERIVSEFRAWAAKRVAMGLRDLRVEEFRAAAKNVPPSPNAWGSLPRLLIRSGLITPKTHPDGSQVYAKAAAVKTRAHPVAVYFITNPGPAASAADLHQTACRGPCV
jgi:hypothetical protein